MHELACKIPVFFDRLVYLKEGRGMAGQRL
jgi:hypothetical protein